MGTCMIPLGSGERRVKTSVLLSRSKKFHDSKSFPLENTNTVVEFIHMF